MADNRDNIAQALMNQQGGGGGYVPEWLRAFRENFGREPEDYGSDGGGAPAQPAQAPTAMPFPQARAPQEAYQLPQPGPQGGAYGQPAGGGLKMINGQIDQNDAGNIAAYYRMMGMGGGGGGAPAQPAYQPQPVAYSPQGVAAIPGNFGPDQVQAMGPQILMLKAQGQQIPDWQQQVLDAYQGGMAPGTTLAIRGSPAGGPAPMAAPSQIQAPGGSYGDGAGISSSGGGGIGGASYGGSDFAGGGGAGGGGYNPFGPTTPYSTYGASQGSGAAGGFGNQGYEAGWAGQGFAPGFFGSIGSGSIGYDTGVGDVPGLNGGGIGMYPGWGGFGA